MALLDAFRAALAEAGAAGLLIATDATIASAAFQSADVGELVPLVRDDAYLPALLELVDKHDVGLLVPLTDLDLLMLAAERGRFAEAGCTVMIGSPEAARLCRDKTRLADLCRQAGLGAIETFSLEAFGRRPFYPCFVKPVGGSAGIGASAIADERQLEAHVARFGEDLLVQQTVDGQEFTVDVYRSRDGAVRCAVPRQRLAVRCGEVAHGITVRDDRLIADTVKLAGLLGDLWGAFCCQCRRGADGVPRFFEVNARFGGGVPLSIAAGADLPLYLIQEVLGLPITAEMNDFTDRLLMLRHDQAVFVEADDPTALPGYDTPSFR